jgi:hypothetical protein
VPASGGGGVVVRCFRQHHQVGCGSLGLPHVGAQFGNAFAACRVRHGSEDGTDPRRAWGAGHGLRLLRGGRDLNRNWARQEMKRTRNEAGEGAGARLRTPPTIRRHSVRAPQMRPEAAGVTSSTARPWRPHRIRSTLAVRRGHGMDRVNRTGRNEGWLLIGTASALLGLLSVASCSDPLRGGLPGTGGSAGGGGLPGAGGIVGTGGVSALGGSGGVTTGGLTGTFGTGGRLGSGGSNGDGRTGGSVGTGGTSGFFGIGGTISHGGVSGPSGGGGVVSFGGISGSSGGSAVGGASGSGGATPPLQHRSTPASCPSQRGSGPPFCAGGTCTSQPYPSGVPTTCSTDSQCTHGANGRCFPWEGLVTAGGCSYDECSTDSDCGARTPCLCRSSSTDNSANMCDVGGNCALDSDCGLGGYCSPSMETCYSTNPEAEVEGRNRGNPNPYYCHTASDLCINDSDCAPLDAGTATTSPLAYTPCAYNVQDERWECTQFVCGFP